MHAIQHRLEISLATIELCLEAGEGIPIDGAIESTVTDIVLTKHSRRTSSRDYFHFGLSEVEPIEEQAEPVRLYKPAEAGDQHPLPEPDGNSSDSSG